MPNAQDALVARLRAMLATQPTTREVPMFGGRSFMVDEQLTVSALKSGGLLVRIPPERHGELTALPGVRQAEMGTGRSMGPSWIHVDAAVIATDDGLGQWVGIALERNENASQKK